MDFSTVQNGSLIFAYVIAIILVFRGTLSLKDNLIILFLMIIASYVQQIFRNKCNQI